VDCCTQGTVAQSSQERLCQGDERHHGSEGISGEAQEEASVRQFRQDSGVARAHGDTVQQQPPAKCVYDGAEMVGLGNAGSTGGYRYIRPLPGRSVESSEGRQPVLV
jgi:hypothetical protein